VRRVVAVGLGIAVAYGALLTVVLGVLAPLHPGTSPMPGLAASMLSLLTSVSFFGGGLLTGFVAHIPAPHWKSASLHSPGLYATLLWLPFVGHTASPPLALVAAFLSMVIASAAGVLLGSRLRRRPGSA